MRARHDGESDHIHVFLDSSLYDHLHGLMETRIDDLEASVFQRVGHNLGAPVVPVQTGFSQKDSGRASENHFHLRYVQGLVELKIRIPA